jgi:hypothetical protein
VRRLNIEDHPNGVMTWQLLQNILKNFWEFRELYEQHGIEEIVVVGVTVNIHDVLQGISDLPPRQKEAVILMCLENRKEEEVARMMGFTRWSSQVGLYKRLGLTRICRKFWNNKFYNGEVNRHLRSTG